MKRTVCTTSPDFDTGPIQQRTGGRRVSKKISKLSWIMIFGAAPISHEGILDAAVTEGSAAESKRILLNKDGISGRLRPPMFHLGCRSKLGRCGR